MNGLRLVPVEDGFDLMLGKTLLLRHRKEAPAFFLGRGRAQIAMDRGNFDIADRLDERVALRATEVRGEQVKLAPSGRPGCVAHDHP